MSQATELQYTLEQFAQITQKAQQALELFGKLWEERTGIYERILFEQKDGKGILRKHIPDLTNGYGNDLARLSTINARERRIRDALVGHQQETSAMLSRLFDVIGRETINGVPLRQLCNAQLLERLQALSEQYFREIAHAQELFLLAEEAFLHAPSHETLRLTYCKMVWIQERHGTMLQEHMNDVGDIAVTPGQHLQRLLQQVERRETATTDPATRGTLERIRRQLAPLVNRENAKFDGNFRERMTFWLTAKPIILTSTFIQMGIIIPLLYKASEALAGGAPELHWYTIDFFGAFIGYTAYSINQIFGISHSTVRPIGKLLENLRSRTGSANPLRFECVETVCPR